MLQISRNDLQTRQWPWEVVDLLRGPRQVGGSAHFGQPTSAASPVLLSGFIKEEEVE